MVRAIETASVCDCSAEVFWQLRMDVGFDEYLAKLEKQHFKVLSLSEEAEHGEVVVDRTTSIAYQENPIPSSLRGVLGKEFSFTIKGRWHRDLYDKDMREEVQDETGGGYKKLLYFILTAPDAYIADIIDMACNEAAILEFGCDEICLLEVFVTHTQEELQAGRSKWEGRTDKSLVDFINSNLGSSYRHLNRLLQLLMAGDREEEAEADEDKAAEQVATLRDLLADHLRAQPGLLQPL